MSGGNREWEGATPDRSMPTMILVYVSEVEKIIGRKLTLEDLDKGVSLPSRKSAPPQQNELVAAARDVLKYFDEHIHFTEYGFLRRLEHLRTVTEKSAPEENNDVDFKS